MTCETPNFYEFLDFQTEKEADNGVLVNHLPLGSTGSILTTTYLNDRERPLSILNRPLAEITMRSISMTGIDVIVNPLFAETTLAKINKNREFTTLFDLISLIPPDFKKALGSQTYYYVRSRLREYFKTIAIGAEGYIIALTSGDRTLAPISPEAEVTRRLVLFEELKPVFFTLRGPRMPKLTRNAIIFCQRFGLLTENPQPSEKIGTEYGLCQYRADLIAGRPLRYLKYRSSRNLLLNFVPFRPQSLARTIYGMTCEYDLLCNPGFLGFTKDVRVSHLEIPQQLREEIAFRYRLYPSDGLHKLLKQLRLDQLQISGLPYVLTALDKLIPPDFRRDSKLSGVRYHPVQGS